MPPHRPPAIAPASSVATIETSGGPGTKTPITPAARPPSTSWPSAPMLNRPARNASAIPSAGKSSAVADTSVSANSDVVPNAPSKSAPKPSIGETRASSIARLPTPNTTINAMPRSRTTRERKIAAISRAPAISAPMRPRSTSARSNAPTKRPPDITSTRSASAKISSSSNEISNTATPALRASISRDCTSVAAPTSMPRVGW